MYGSFDKIREKLLKPELKIILAWAMSCVNSDEMYIVEELATIRQKLVDERCENR